MTTVDLSGECNLTPQDVEPIVHLMVDLTFEAVPPSTSSIDADPEEDRVDILSSLTIRKHQNASINNVDQAVPFATLLPGLSLLKIDELPDNLLPVRLRNRLESLSWNDLLQLSIRDLLGMQNVGLLSVEELWGRLVNLAKSAADRGLLTVAPSVRGPLDYQDLSSAALLLRWAREERDATNISDVLTLAIQDAPRAVREEWLRCGTAEIHAGDTPKMADEQVKQLLETASDLVRTILTQRHSPLGPRATLEEIGDRRGVTRERIRQVEAKYLAECAAALSSSNRWALRARCEDLRNRIGVICNTESARFQSTVMWVVDGMPEHLKEPALGLMFRLAGPYRVDGRWICRRDEEAITPANIARRLFADGPAGRADLETRAPLIDLHPDQVSELLDEAGGILEFNSLIFRRSTPLGELVCSYLHHVGHPLDTDQLLELMMLKSPSERSARNALHLEPAIHRTRKEQWALVEWGLPEYTSVHELMLAAIRESGGQMTLDDLAARLRERFGVPSTSVNMVAQRPLFVVEDGWVRERTDEPLELHFDLDRAVGVRKTSYDALSWTVGIDKDILRGSGRKAPEALLLELGIRPGDSREFHVDGQSFSLNWPPAAASAVSSIREVVKAHGGEVGDTVVLLFHDRDSVSIRVVQRQHLADDPISAVASLLGAREEAIEDNPLEALAVELNVVAGNDRSMLKRSIAALRALGEEQLASVLASTAADFS